MGVSAGGRRDFPVLVEQLRGGPPLLSPFRVPKVDAVANTLELFVHHEDIRRAQPDWSPRVLDDDAERLLWTLLRPLGRRLVRDAPVGVRLEDTVSGSTAVLRAGDPSVTVRGRPSELAVFVHGRQEQARVQLIGQDDAAGRLRAASLRIGGAARA